MIKKILVPVDGSEYSDKALDEAVDLATKYSAELHLVHVVPIATALITGPEALAIDVSRQLETSGERILKTALERVEKAGLKAVTRLEHGQPADRLIQLVKDESFDLVVIGSRGLGAIARFFLGSVSDKVSHHATCSVLIAR
jgi:nucleotide-binding universal stress UspA family protein